MKFKENFEIILYVKLAGIYNPGKDGLSVVYPPEQEDVQQGPAEAEQEADEVEGYVVYVILLCTLSCCLSCSSTRALPNPSYTSSYLLACCSYIPMHCT